MYRVTRCYLSSKLHVVTCYILVYKCVTFHCEVTQVILLLLYSYVVHYITTLLEKVILLCNTLYQQRVTPNSLYIIIAGVDFTPGQYNVTITPGATTANTSIPVTAGNYSEVIKQFRLRLFIDGAAYEQCVFSGNVSTATITVCTGIIPGILCIKIESLKREKRSISASYKNLKI